MDKQSNKKIIIFLTATLILAVSIPILTLILRGKLPLLQPEKVQPKLVKETTVSKVAAELHPELFYAQLEYNPRTQTVTQLVTSKASGDIPILLATPPASDTNLFIYKIEIVSDKNVLLEAGWDAKYKSIITTGQNTYQFRVITKFYKDAFIRVYLPDNKLIWTGVIK